MTTTIYFNEMPIQRIARGNSKRWKIAEAKEMAKPREITQRKWNLIRRWRNRELG